VGPPWAVPALNWHAPSAGVASEGLRTQATERLWCKSLAPRWPQHHACNNEHRCASHLVDDVGDGHLAQGSALQVETCVQHL
jgi:hypothetical protein